MDEWPHRLCLDEGNGIKQSVLGDLSEIKSRLESFIPGSRLLLAGSLTYGEGLVRKSGDGLKYKSDIDIFVLSNSFKALRCMFRSIDKDSLLKGTQVQHSKFEVFFVWKPLLLLRNHLVTGKDMNDGKHVLFGEGVSKELRYHSLKKGFISLVKAREGGKDWLSYAGIYCLRSKMCEGFDKDSIFILKDNLEWIRKSDYFSGKEKDVLERCVLYKLGETDTFGKDSFSVILDATKRIYGERRQGLNIYGFVQYLSYCIKSKRFPRMVNFSRLILDILCDYVSGDLEKAKTNLLRLFPEEELNGDILVELARFNIIRK